MKAKNLIAIFHQHFSSVVSMRVFLRVRCEVSVRNVIVKTSYSWLTCTCCADVGLQLALMQLRERSLREQNSISFDFLLGLIR